MTDEGTALRTAIVRSFTGYLTIDKYCDVFLNNQLPPSYIRTDVAHFINLYAKDLKEERRLVKKFFLGLIGKIMLARDLNSARKTIIASLIVSLSETEGDKNSETPCNIHKEYLQNLVTRELDEFLAQIENENLEPENENSDSEDKYWNADEKIYKSAWTSWGEKIMEEVNPVLGIGDQINGYFCLTFAKRLIKDIRHLPM